MPGKRWPSGGVQGGVPQDPRDMAKAGLLEAQSPEVKVRTRRNDACYRRRVMPGHEPVGPGTLRGSERRPVRAVKEMSGRPTSCSIRTTTSYHGIAYGARVLWRRSARSSRRRNDLPRRPGTPVTGRRGTGGREVQRWEVCVMQNATTVLDVIGKRGRKGLPISRLYRQLFNPQLFLLA